MAEQPDIRSHRLGRDEIEANFGDLHPPLSRSEALIEADRCYFCYDAPCTAACPTEIDIPVFIQKIRSDNIRGSAHTILRENIMGGMCARVCPTEVLCEEACVREAAEGKPVEIGRLQRFATDTLMVAGTHPFERASPTGKRVAVVGAGFIGPVHVEASAYGARHLRTDFIVLYPERGLGAVLSLDHHQRPNQ